MTADATTPRPGRRRPPPAAPDPNHQPIAVAVTITIREIYDAVIRLTSRVDAALDHSEHTTEKVQDHEQRLRALEALRWPIPTAAVLIALISLAVAVFVK